MKKFFSVIAASIVCVLLLIGGVACGGGNSGTDKPLVISNKPTANTLTITNDVNSYQFELSDYDGSVEWISTVKSVATVSKSGLLTMLKGGVTEVIVRDAKADKSDSVSLTIVDERTSGAFTVTGLPTDGRLPLSGGAVQLGYTYTGGETSVVWGSTDPNVATVSATGLLTPVSTGFTTVSVAKADDESVRTTVRVEVIGAEITGLSIENIPTYGVLKGKIYTLSVKCQPENCARYDIEWSVDDTDIAVVDQQGNFIAIAEGECTLTAKAVGTDVQAQKTVRVETLSKDKEDFRYASVGTSNVFDVGPNITFSNLDAEIIEYGDDFAMLIKTRGNGVYNYFAVDFGELPAGEYEVQIRFDVLSGEHDGAITREGEANLYKTLGDAADLGDHLYSFTLTHNGGLAKLRFVNRDWNAVSQVAVDDLSIKKSERKAVDPVKTTATPITFDGAENGASAADYGVYMKPGKATVQDGKANIAANKVEQVVLALGDVNRGIYKLKFDATITGDFPAIFQIVEEFIVYDTKEISWGALTTLYNAAGKKLTDFVKPVGNTYEITLSFNNDYKSVGFILINNETKECGMTLDNISFTKVDFTTKQTLQNFENGLLNTCASAGAWSEKPSLVNAANAHFDYKATKGALVTEDNNTYYQVAINSSNTYSRLNIGWFEAGTYTFSFRVKASGENLNAGLTLSQCVDHETSPLKAFANPPAHTKVDKTFTGEWTEYTMQITLTEAKFIKLGFNNGSAAKANCTVCFDDIAVIKTA